MRDELIQTIGLHKADPEVPISCALFLRIIELVIVNVPDCGKVVSQEDWARGRARRDTPSRPDPGSDWSKPA